MDSEETNPSDNGNNRFEEKKKKRRAELLDAALSVIREKGFNETRVKDITEKAGTAVGNFYRYFESKEAIFEALITQFYEIIKEKVELLAQEQIPSFKSVKRLFREYVDIFLENQTIALVFIEQLGGINEKYTQMKFDFIDNVTSVTESIISRIVKEGIARIQNPMLTARAWTGTLLESFRWWVRHGQDMITADEWVDNVTNFLIKGTVAK